MDNKKFKMQSAAVSLSDMEIFVFPNLMYSLVLANIMSPNIWKWLEEPKFEGFDKLSPYRKVVKLKQYIMDNYVFNLDLDTWGLTTQEEQIKRFSDIIDPSVLSESNALFGYHGDEYYFDIDIRRHFRLDKYDGNVIPYWKTETVEAMDSFVYKDSYSKGAGECVSLAALYAAAMFVVAKVPLKDIYMMATPLHSQGFIDINGGVLFNNRRLVTKNMWFNGSALSAQARRALENEQVTIVSHETGYTHVVYDEASLDAEAFETFSTKLRAFLTTNLDSEILCNFLRQDADIRKCFQMRCVGCGERLQYIPVERVLEYEHGSPYRLSDNTRPKLMASIDCEEFHQSPMQNRIILNDVEECLNDEIIDLSKEECIEKLKKIVFKGCCNAERAANALIEFCITKPKLPDFEKKKKFLEKEPNLGVTTDMSREEIIERLESIRELNEMADMAFYAYRDLTVTDYRPFYDAAFNRNPVSIVNCENMSDDEIVAYIRKLENISIYSEDGRLAQPDEVWNYKRGDGAEKAILLGNILASRKGRSEVAVELKNEEACVYVDGQKLVSFVSKKNLNIPKYII
ncbi:MAG: hypothetical protein PF692_04185 [Kiritimatiellae bacterium]|jgi:hypothetical protein|nr:hypothetical protein [Kiritimatiellia bacterium]